MSDSNPAEARFAVCIRNEGYPASLELRKLYQIVSDPEAAATGQLRIIDESEEDYLYPAEYFLTVALPDRVEAALLRAS
jgi:hypothetical protein